MSMAELSRISLETNLVQKNVIKDCSIGLARPTRAILNLLPQIFVLSAFSVQL